MVKIPSKFNVLEEEESITKNKKRQLKSTGTLKGSASEITP
jgi:hypothetical protein